MFNKPDLTPLPIHVPLAVATPHAEMLEYVRDAFEKNWITTEGDNVREVEKIAAQKAGVKYAVGLACCTAALHLCVKAAGEKLYGRPAIGTGAVENKRVFCSDMTFDATVNPVVYEHGIPVFIDTERDTWNMDPAALEKAFGLYPDVKLVVFAHLYGFPGKIREIKEICERHGALLIEDAAEAMGATWKGKQIGSFGDLAAISYNGNKIITGSSGGCLLTNDLELANHVRKLATQAREPAPWYQHEELGYNYRLSNIVAGCVRGQYPYLEEHIAQKKAVWERYRDGLRGYPVRMNPWDEENASPNYWLSAILIDRDAMCRQERSDYKAEYFPEHGKSCPTEILEALTYMNADGRPIWKPMHLQPMYRANDFVTVGKPGEAVDVGADVFERGVCLPSDNKMTPDVQDRIIEAIRRCFD